MDNFKSVQRLSKKWEAQSNPPSNISYYCNELLTQFNLQTRIERAVFFPNMPIEPTIDQQQRLLRTRMRAIETTFIRNKYTCSIFLSSLLHDCLKVDYQKGSVK
jgi:hypothetical protein